MQDKNKRIVNIFVAIFIIILIIAIIALLIMKYEVEGEQNLPFELSKIIIVSSAQGENTTDSVEEMNFRIDQNNDIYIYINKNENLKEEKAIKSISISNFQILTNPQKGTPVVIRPSNVNGILFKNSQEYEVTDELQYTGALESNIENLEIGNQGGIIYLRHILKDLGTYVANSDEQVIHDGALLKKIQITDNQIKYSISFDLTLSIEKGKSYKANITLDLPSGDIIENGNSHLEITDLDNIVFKRI